MAEKVQTDLNNYEPLFKTVDPDEREDRIEDGYVGTWPIYENGADLKYDPLAQEPVEDSLADEDELSTTAQAQNDAQAEAERKAAEDKAAEEKAAADKAAADSKDKGTTAPSAPTSTTKK